MKRILVIAGSDSSGGAGLEADQKVIAAHGCYAMTATTALTAQNTLGVDAIHEIPSDFVRRQIDACVSDIGVDVVKTGMLASADTVSMVAKALREHKIAVSVIDPVMVATTGAKLLPDAAVKTLCNDLLPETYILTPNIPEAKLILQESGREQSEIRNVDDLIDLARAIHRLGVKYVLLKGGHIPLTAKYEIAALDEQKEIVVNVLVGEDVCEVFDLSYRKSKNTHGTGCSLASAIACNLAQSRDVPAAVFSACRYVDAGIRLSINLGKGSGPINHFHSLQILPFTPGNFTEYLLSRADVKPAWHDFTHHEFVRQMGDGTLPLEWFKYYMIQDYIYLIHFARANALAGYKTKSLDGVARAAEIVLHIREETALHIRECAELGLTMQQIEESEESQACTAYTRYVLDIGQSEDWLALQISLLPCLLGYHVIAKRLDELQRTDPPATANRYKTWIDNYVNEGYSSAVTTGCALIEKHIVHQSPRRINELVKIFIQATRMETGFWDMASAP
ncbi:Phosphomethylpyrimidine kinase-domain-containing protein [Neohortaea acidophila]|uniref:Phosphomethylpyrimidine kinase-domain-containing protein n=1 Tax=Neohortaea acidophila TaxID=245834 RepID=A0A6A6Q637_9PEZI|nr:Phosphomethylpyrimidine kinase-domain-containing protein [Neohortaea acidophila]KAF2487850.1 Phosphomethylpyrimidine kinase-domain-containing protein [Neohortaea acidophila]